MSAKLTAEQIDYMREVLGLEHVLVPFVQPDPYAGEPLPQYAPPPDDGAFETAFAPSEIVSEWRTSGDENAAKVTVLVASETASFPLDGESGELMRKMIAAMKFSSSDVFILEWNHAHVPAPGEIKATLLRSPKPVLIFGAKTARSLVGHFPRVGEWSSWEGVRFVATESPQELLVRPELKRTAWAHMQVFMKLLTFG